MIDTTTVLFDFHNFNISQFYCWQGKSILSLPSKFSQIQNSPQNNIFSGVVMRGNGNERSFSSLFIVGSVLPSSTWILPGCADSLRQALSGDTWAHHCHQWYVWIGFIYVWTICTNEVQPTPPRCKSWLLCPWCHVDRAMTSIERPTCNRRPHGLFLPFEEFFLFPELSVYCFQSYFRHSQCGAAAQDFCCGFWVVVIPLVRPVSCAALRLIVLQY